MASGTFIVFSNLILAFGQFSPGEVVFIYIFPWFMLWVFLFYDVVLSKQHRIEIIMMTIIMILGIINVYLSDYIYLSFISMRIFILSGIVQLWTSMLIIADDSSRKIMYFISCCWLFILTSIEIINYLITGSDLLFMSNPIPIGTFVILLMFGPLYILVSGQKIMKFISAVLIIMGLILIIVANKRGTYLAIAGMVLAWIYYRYMRKSIYAIIASIICLTIIVIGSKYFKTLNKEIPNHFTILHRLELYPFALHIYQKHPFFGTGLRAFSHESYLGDYQINNKSLDIFNQTVIQLQTFDNMALTGFVELGSIMAICYLGLIFFIVYRYCRNTQPFSLNNKKEFVLLLPLLGLAIHSMTYDCLMFPQINWLFHVQLGILGGFSKV
jgi:O-antigen ligase